MTAASGPRVDGLPAPWAEPLLDRIAAAGADGRVLVLDDDPTGTQTVVDIPVLLELDEAELGAALAADPLVYLSTNSRALSSADAAALATAVGAAVAALERRDGRRITVLSRGDSTLRGHFPGEVEPLQRALATDLLLLVPALIEAGRITVDGVHWVRTGDGWVPAGESEFARDATFGYRSSDLREWVAEHVPGTRPDDVTLVGLDLLRRGGPDAVADLLAGLAPGSTAVADAVVQEDLQVLAAGVLEAERRGRRTLVRCAASYVRARSGRTMVAQIEIPQRRGPGLLVVGSHVRRTSEQLASLLAEVDLATVELDVASAVAGTLDPAVVTGELDAAIGSGRPAALVTSRAVLQADTPTAALANARAISDAQAQVVRRLRDHPGFIVAKGGITSYKVVRDGLGARRARVLGPVAPGVSLWQVDAEERFGRLPLCVFAGNVGEPGTLLDLWRRLSPPEA